MMTTSTIAFFGVGLVELLLLFPIFLLSILGFVFWVWMLVDCLVNEPSEGNDKLVWVVVIIFTNVIGAVIYFLVRRPKRLSESGS